MSCSCASYGSYIGNINCPSIPIPNLGLPCPPVSTVGTVDSVNVLYSGAALACTGIATGDNLQTILGKIDAVVCTSIGDFSSFNTFCLAPIGTLQEFVETISEFVCDTQDQVDTFINTTFPAYQTSVSNSFTTITNPNITGCASSGIVAGDTLNGIIVKLSNSICDIYTNKLSLAGVPWSQCFVVGSAPTSIAAAFGVVINQICQLNTLISTGGGGGGTLPTFNTVGSCLPSPQAADTLESVVNKLIIRTCQAPTFDINALTWGCLSKPNNNTTDLQSAFQTILTNVSTLNTLFPFQYSSDFVVTNVDNGNPCLGKLVSLSTSLNQDRLVAATPSDTSPGTLQDKLNAGTDISFDYFAVPGKVTLNVNNSAAGDGKTYVDAGDTVKDFLLNKIEGNTPNFGISITPALDLSNPSHKVQLNINIDSTALVNALINAIGNDPTLSAAFCTLVNNCPSPCAAPSNVTVTYNSVGLTTTTSTTTTTTTT